MPRKSNLSTQTVNKGLQKAKPVTSYDVAREAGVSQSAVSRYLTPGASVSPQTRAKILKAVNKLGFRPNELARSLRGGRPTLVAVIVANLGFAPEFASVLTRTLSARGFNTLLFTLDQESDADHVIDQIWQYRVAGVVSAVTLPVRHVDMLSEKEIALIFINRAYEDRPVNSVACDQSEGERWLVDGLCAAGHKKLAIISGPEDSPVSRQRVSSAAERLAKAGIKPLDIVIADFTYLGGREAMRKLAERKAIPDAVICANDMQAIGCMDEARYGLNLEVPKDISIVGFDGSAAGQWASYELVTVRQPTDLMVDAAIDMLVARMDDSRLIIEKRVFSGELVKGSSARLAKP